jgi:hypothetical protein
MEESVQHSEIEGIQMQCEVHVRQEHHHGKRYEDVIDEKQFEIEQAEKRRAEHSASVESDKLSLEGAKSEIERLTHMIFR